MGGNFPGGNFPGGDFPRTGCAKSVNDVIENLQSDLKIALKWFKDHQMMANPGKFQFMILSKNTINKSIVIDNKTVESSKSVKRLELTIDNKLNLGIHINNIYGKWLVRKSKV